MDRVKATVVSWYPNRVPIAGIVIAMTLASPPPPEPTREFRAVWVASVDYIDFPADPGLTVDAQRTALRAIVNSCTHAKLNAILFQARPSADALYSSSLEPWSEYLTGKQGSPTNPKWDPFAELIALAHDAGIEVHAWINPFRAKHPSAKGDLASNHVSRQFPNDVLTYGRNLWMDPASGPLRRHTLDVVRDLVRRYDIDGVHIDDYFYPYPVKGVKFPDDASYANFVKGGGKLSRSAWRRENVNGFVHDLHHLIKIEKPWLMVGISPFGIYRPNIPKGIEAGLDQFADLYADPLKWAKEGWCDYLAPQLYWKLDSKGQPCAKLLEWWRDACGTRVDCWPGLFTSRLGTEFGDWPYSEISLQVERSRKDRNRTGHVHFSQRAFRHDFKNIATKGSAKLYPEFALVPERRGARGNLLAAPKVEIQRTTPEKKLHIFATREGSSQFALQQFNGKDWEFLGTSKSGNFVLNGDDDIAIAAMDEWGRLSPWTIVKVTSENQSAQQ